MTSQFYIFGNNYFEHSMVFEKKCHLFVLSFYLRLHNTS